MLFGVFQFAQDLGISDTMIEEDFGKILIAIAEVRVEATM